MFIDDFIEHFSNTLDAPSDYFHAVGLGLVSSCLSRDVCIDLDQGRVTPNLWFILTGKSSSSRKSRSMNLPLTRVMPETVISLAPNDVTKERFVSYLEEYPRCLIQRQEFCGWVGEMTGKRYMTGFKEFLMDLYDGFYMPYRRETKKGTAKYIATKVVKNTYVILMSSTTIGQMNQMFTTDDIITGFLPRFIWVHADRKKYKPLSLRTVEVQQDAEYLKAQLREIYQHFHKKPKIDIDKDAWKKFQEYCRRMDDIRKKDDVLRDPFYARMEWNVVKFMILYRVQDMKSEPKHEIQEYHVDKAVKDGNKFLKHAFIIVNELKGISVHREDKQINWVETIIKDAGKDGITQSILLRKSRMKSKTLKEIIITLIDGGTVFSEIERGSTKATHRYMHIDNTEF